jgi:hypothetical protein
LEADDDPGYTPDLRIGVACRMPKLLRRTALDYPGVDPVKFEAWHRADLRSAIAFLIASWGVLFLQIGLLAACR